MKAPKGKWLSLSPYQRTASFVIVHIALVSFITGGAALSRNRSDCWILESILYILASSRDNEDVDSDDKDESVDDFSDEISTNLTSIKKKTILTSGQIRELHSPLVGFVALAVQLPSAFLTWDLRYKITDLHLQLRIEIHNNIYNKSRMLRNLIYSALALPPDKVHRISNHFYLFYASLTDLWNY